MLETNDMHSGRRLGSILAWWNETRDRWARVGELRDLPPQELGRVAADIGVSAVELLDLSARPNGTQELLERRLAALRLEPEEIRQLSPLLLRELQRTCAMCTERARCKDDMALSPLEPGWESYCPNAGTLRTLV